MKVEVLSVTGCPHHDAAMELVRQALVSAGLPVEIEVRWIDDAAQASTLDLRGSPTVRIDGENVEPATPRPCLACSVNAEGTGVPSHAALTSAIDAALQRRKSP